MTVTDRLVLDSSIAIAWCFADEKDPYADAIAARLAGIEAHVPSFWPLEIANAFLKSEERGRSTQADTTKWTTYFGSLPITLDDGTGAHAWGSTLNLARLQNLSLYEAGYLELALRRGLPLATLNAGLKAAAASSGVPLYRLID